MRKILIAISVFLSLSASALAGPVDDFNNAAVDDLWTPTLWSFGLQTPTVSDGFFIGDSVIRCSSPNDREDRNRLSSIYAFYNASGPTWLFPNTVTDCSQAGAYDPVFVSKQ